MHAGNIRLVDFAGTPGADVGPADIGTRVHQAKRAFLERAAEDELAAFQRFAHDQASWLDDYVLFQSIRTHFQGQPWWRWQNELKYRDGAALTEFAVGRDAEFEDIRFGQFLFARQWQSLKSHANARGMRIFGDVPIFVAEDSADVWTHQGEFLLDDQGYPKVVAGVPPDCFSATGQRWGNPQYDWDAMRENGYEFWQQRIRAELARVDILRIDHFRGFSSSWHVPSNEQTAINGQWVSGPGGAFFQALYEAFGSLPLVAEDLGTITPDVVELRDRFGLPGMKILQFAFDGGPDNPYLPFHHVLNSVVYTGTHDNNTTMGWLQELDKHRRRRLKDYLGQGADEDPQVLIRTALASVARLAVLPMQDLLGLDGRHRMNTPAVVDGNWRWRFSWEQVSSALSAELRGKLELFDRLAVS